MAEVTTDPNLADDPGFKAAFAAAKKHERLVQYSLPVEEPKEEEPPALTVNIITPHLLLGGAERQTVELAIALSKLGWGVTLTVQDMTDACPWFMRQLAGCPEVAVQSQEGDADLVLWWGNANGPLDALYVNHCPTGPVPDDIKKEIKVWGDGGIPNGIDPTPYKALRAPVSRPVLRVGMLGRLDDNKGVGVALSALGMAPDCTLLLAGDGDPMNLPIPDSILDRVMITGPIPPEQFLSGIDVLLNASETEGMPLSAVEAAMSRRCIVHCGAGDLPRHFPGSLRAFQVARVPQAIANQLQLLALYPEVMDLSVERAYDYAMENLTAEKMAVAYDKELRSIRKLKALCLADQPGWAHERGHQDCQIYCSDDIRIDIHVIRDWPEVPLPDISKYDVVFTPYTRTGGAWKCLDTIPKSKMVAAMRSSEYDYDNLGALPTQETIDLVNSYRAFQVVTRRNYNELKSHCPNVVHLPNPVNLKKFPRLTEVRDLAVCWSGNTNRKYQGHAESIKGYDEYIVPACETAGVPLNPLFYSKDPDERTPHEDMNAWYCKSSVLLLPSTFEGCSKTLLEAMASGLAVVCTGVGTAREMQDAQLREWGETGIIIVDRDVDQIAGVLMRLHDNPDILYSMGRLNRQEVEARWSWDTWASSYVDFLKKGVRYGG